MNPNIKAIVYAKDDTVLAILNPISLTGPMIGTGPIDRLELQGFGGRCILNCDLSDNNMGTEAGTGDLTVTLHTTDMITEYLRIKDTCNVEQLFGLFQLTLVKYTGKDGILWNNGD